MNAQNDVNDRCDGNLDVNDANDSNDANHPEAAMPENARECPIPAGPSFRELTEQQRTAVGLLLLGRSLRAVASGLEVDPKTLYRWRQDERFQAELKRRGDEMWDGAATRLRALVHPALDVLEEEVHDEYDRSRVRAAGMILRFADLRKSVPPPKAEE